MHMRVSIFLFFVFASSLHAAAVLRVGKDMTNIAISHDPARKWAMGERVCILQRFQEIACGVIVKVVPQGAVVRLSAPSNDVMAGDKAVGKPQTGAAPAQQKLVAPLMDSVPDSQESGMHSFNLSGGVAVGTSFFYPTLSAQLTVAPTIAVGINTFFLSAPSSIYTLLAFGGAATVNYYAHEYFRGLWVQVAAGLGHFRLSDGVTTETATVFTSSTTVGWRGYWDLGLNIGAGAGLQFWGSPSFTSGTVTASGFQPFLCVDIGISF